jgi:hypothetical protein
MQAIVLKETLEMGRHETPGGDGEGLSRNTMTHVSVVMTLLCMWRYMASGDTWQDVRACCYDLATTFDPDARPALLCTNTCVMRSQIHGNVCMQAVVVTETLDWRLHGFDLLSEHQPPPGTEWPLMNAGWMVRGQRLSPSRLVVLKFRVRFLSEIGHDLLPWL